MKVLLSGAAAAAISGVLLGGAMQPHLDAADGRPAGPQMFANWSGVRSTGPFDPGTTFASYPGRVPDYVTGTDWKKAMAWPGEMALAWTVYAESPPVAHVYPSLGGAEPSAVEPQQSEDQTPAAAS